ncbi:Dbl homology domain-containing protein [Mycena epipterygia]|nr:Dbl homology domain-containing protein [Mycena epipterygia]
MSRRRNAQEVHRNNIVRELIETERKYVRDLETMQKYATALSKSNFLDQDTFQILFPNINLLVDFQWKFLIRLEGSADLPWQDQRWGWHFLQSVNTEEEFRVYERYCANYINISDISHLVLGNEQKFATFNHLIHFKAELPAFLAKPVSRVCKYPLLLDSLIKVSSPSDQHYAELKSGSEAAKRVTDRICKVVRLVENEQTVKSLRTRVHDWRGHRVDDFGELLLDDVLVVTRSGIHREYHVFLFERIILCDYSLDVWWDGDDGDDGLESFTLHCRYESQMRQWEAQLNRLISECVQRRFERSASNIGVEATDPWHAETWPEESVDSQVENTSNQSHPPHDDGTYEPGPEEDES